MKLAEFPPKKRYTLREHRMFAKLPKNGRRVGTHDIAAANGKEWDVQYPLKNITVTMLRLMAKVDANKEPFRICKEDRYAGHNRLEYWVEPRKKANGK